MRKSLEVLEREHRWIGTMARCLEKLVAEARASQQLSREAAELVHLYESFADGRHQEKEEEVLIPALLDASSAKERTLLEALLRDHVTERIQMAAMRRNLLGAVHGEPLCVRSFTSAASEYLDLHRAHVAREQGTLLPLAERLLSEAEDHRVLAGFEAIEGGPGDPRGLAEEVHSLERRIDPPAPPAA